MSIVQQESILHYIKAGFYKGNNCKILQRGFTAKNLAKVIITGKCDGKIVTVQISSLVELDCPGWDRTHVETITYGLDQYFAFEEGNGTNMLRTATIAHPAALQVGDVLSTGEEILSPSRRGYNDSVIVLLGKSRWVEIASRLPLALCGNKKFKLAVELTPGDTLATGCNVVRIYNSFKEHWITVCLDNRDCRIEIPDCIPLALA